jgi:uncharacterized protein YigA (DUF484 family)
MAVAAADMNEKEILDYLERHPDFLRRHPELLDVLAPPERELGGGVLDFQAFQLKNLQKNTRSLQSKHAELIDFCRDNLSAQSQVHDAVLRLIRARNLEQLLEVITLDLVSLFNVDVVRLAVESEVAPPYGTFYSEDNYSGIVFVDTGLSDALIPDGKKSLLVEDTLAQKLPGFDQIFAECSGLVNSCAILALELERVPRLAMLAFGVRHAKRFHPGQAIDLLQFLAQIVAHQLDIYLQDAGV